jgi:hypothetical protein
MKTTGGSQSWLVSRLFVIFQITRVIAVIAPGSDELAYFSIRTTRSWPKIQCM